MPDKLTVGSLFSGIQTGGFDLGLERAGMQVIWQVENEPYCQRVLAKHWPDVPRYGDIKEIDWNDVERPDLICGGFPCQPVSLAGKRLAQADERWLWPEVDRCIRVLRPRYVFVENVPGLLSAGISDVLGDLATSGYDAEWDCIPAAAVGAPHLRYRVWVIAHRTGHVAHAQVFSQRPGLCPDGPGGERGRRSGDGRSTDDGTNSAFNRDGWGGEQQPYHHGANRPDRRGEVSNDLGAWWTTEPDVGRVAHGVPARVDRLRGLGNAVVPQVAEWIGRRIMQAN